MEEDVLVHVVGHLGQVGVVLLAQLHDGDLLVLAEGVHQLLVEGLAALITEGQLKGGVVEGDRHQGAVHVGQHLVLVGRPLGEAGEVLVHAVVVGVVDVGAVLVHQDTGLVLVVVGVAGDVVAALQHAHPVAAGLSQATGADGTSIARANDENVVLLRVEVLGETLADVHVRVLSGRPACRRHSMHERCGIWR